MLKCKYEGKPIFGETEPQCLISGATVTAGCDLGGECIPRKALAYRQGRLSLDGMDRTTRDAVESAAKKITAKLLRGDLGTADPEPRPVAAAPGVAPSGAIVDLTAMSAEQLRDLAKSAQEMARARDREMGEIERQRERVLPLLEALREELESRQEEAERQLGAVVEAISTLQQEKSVDLAALGIHVGRKVAYCVDPGDEDRKRERQRAGVANKRSQGSEGGRTGKRNLSPEQRLKRRIETTCLNAKRYSWTPERLEARLTELRARAGAPA